MGLRATATTAAMMRLELGCSEFRSDGENCFGLGAMRARRDGVAARGWGWGRGGGGRWRRMVIVVGVDLGLGV